MKQISKDILDIVFNQTITGRKDSDQLSSAIFGIALTTRGKKFLELGVRDGGTTIPLLAASKLLGAKLTSVDIADPEFSCPNELLNEWQFVKQDAIQFLSSNVEKYDLIFIDDWHEGKHIKKELDLLEPFCDKSTLILLHDLMHHWTNPEYNTCCNFQKENLIPGKEDDWDNGGPYWAVNQLDKNMWEYATIPFANGLTILRKK